MTLAAHIGAYPDLVAVASLLAADSDNVQQRILKRGTGWPIYLLMQINQRTGHLHTDPGLLEEWVNYQLLLGTTRTTPPAQGEVQPRTGPASPVGQFEVYPTVSHGGFGCVFRRGEQLHLQCRISGAELCWAEHSTSTNTSP